ncbi:MAG: hypothetical protein JO199_10355 [Candidatus Eremiobacteraeota bacterium]|nr:hypothetical protein [Candidatus Eremiobacteraeota bacterium]
MVKKIAPLAVGIVAAILAACGGRVAGTAPSSGEMLPMLSPDLSVRAVLPKDAAGEDLPAVLGTVRARGMKGDVGGFTQTSRSQTLAFPPGTKIEIRNLSKTMSHTFNYIETIKSYPSGFPANPSLSMKAHGGDTFGPGYSSGVIAPGKSVTVTLAEKGTYVIGCAFHYGDGMRDVIVVEDHAKPGPQATASPKATGHPTATPTGGGGW